MSYNIRHGWGMDDQIDLQRIAAVIAKAQPDIVALQEVDFQCSRSGKVDQAEVLAQKLDMFYSFASFMSFDDGQYGMAILSKHPLLESQIYHLPDGAEPRSFLEIDIAVGQMMLRVVGVHLDWTDDQVRLNQLQALLKKIEPANTPYILAGDFNAEPSSAPIQYLLDKGWKQMDKKEAKHIQRKIPRKRLTIFSLITNKLKL